jgi:hypothetical protein
MISKTIGFRGTLFSDTPIYQHIHLEQPKKQVFPFFALALFLAPSQTLNTTAQFGDPGDSSAFLKRNGK